MRILRIALLIFCTLFLAVFAALQIGHQQPDDPLLLDIRRCGDHICVFDLAPNTLAFDDAKVLLAADSRLALSAISPSSAYKKYPPFYRLDLYLGEYNSLAEIDLYFETWRILTAYQVVAKFGTPCAMIAHYLPTNMVLVYPGMVIFFENNPRTNATHLAAASKVTQINLLDNDIRDCSQLELTADRVRWRGFRAY